MRSLLLWWLSACALLSAGAPAQARLRVATTEASPFAIKTADGGWEGLSIELWRRIAAAEGLSFDLVEMTLPEMLSALERGDIDLAAAALSLTADREERFDFTHAFLPTGLGIATARADAGLVSRLFGKLLSGEFLGAVAALGIVLLVCGLLVWLFERRANPEQFGGKGLRGVGSGFWFSAVTMTTVGYGDKAPKTLGGRVVALAWMFASIVVISGYTAGIASSLAVDDLVAIRDGDDLAGRAVLTVGGSSGVEWLGDQGLKFGVVPTVEAALDALASGEADAVVYDQPLLRHLVRRRSDDKLVVLPRPVRLEGYAFGLPTESPLQERLNRRVLEAIATDAWRQVVLRYLGT